MAASVVLLLIQINGKCRISDILAGMRARIGNALYYFGCISSVLVVALGIWITLTDDQDGLWPLPAFVVGAAVVWLAGRVSRNVLSGV